MAPTLVGFLYISRRKLPALKVIPVVLPSGGGGNVLWHIQKMN